MPNIRARSAGWLIGSLMIFVSSCPAAAATAQQVTAAGHPWWFWPIILFFFCLVLGILAVMAGVGISVILYVIRQSNQITLKQWVVQDDNGVLEVDPPEKVAPSEVVVMQPYGSLFFATAPVFEQALPTVDETSRGSVVILRLRGRTGIGSTFMDVLERYGRTLNEVGGALVICQVDPRCDCGRVAV